MPNILINGIVAARNMQPYVQIMTMEHGVLAQLTIAEARSIANDIVTMASRTEADAMLVKFFGEMEFPQAAAAALLEKFRDFRSQLDKEHVQKFEQRGEADA